MGRKAGGLAAIMAGQPVVVVKKRSFFWRLKLLTRQGGLHIGLIFVCMIYVYIGAHLFMYLEAPEERRIYNEVSREFEALRHQFLSKVRSLKSQNATLHQTVDKYTQDLMKLFKNPVAINMFDCLFYTSSRNYTKLWTTDSALLFTATTILPVGYGYVTPLTSIGRILLCVYAGFGIPLALVMMSDVGKFFADTFVKLFREKITAFMIVLVALLLIYSFTGGMIISKSVGIPIDEAIYFSTVSIFTIGYGDLSPRLPVSYVITFLVFGVALVTISIDVVAATIIHNVHYMGRQVGKAKIIADKMIMIAQKININRGLGLGMAQLGAFAKMGMLINVNPSGIPKDSAPATRKSTAFDPNIDFDLIDTASPSYLYGFGNIDDMEDEIYY